MKRVHNVVLLLFAILLYGSIAQATEGPSQEELNKASESTDWLLPNHSYESQRFVNLKQIDRNNAAQLRPVCIYSSGDTNRFASNPLVYRGVMFVTTGDTTVAISASNCELKWRHDWKAKAKPAEVKTSSGIMVNPFKMSR